MHKERVSFYAKQASQLIEAGGTNKAIDALADNLTAAEIREVFEAINFYPEPETMEYAEKAVRRRNAEKEALKMLNSIF